MRAAASVALLWIACAGGGDDAPAPATAETAQAVEPDCCDEGTTSIVREYYPSGLLQSETRDGVTTTYTYNADGDLETVSTPPRGTTTYSSYKRGVAQREETAVSYQGQTTVVVVERTVDDAGNIRSVRDGEGHLTSYTYDAAGRLTQITPAGATSSPTTITYTPATATAPAARRVERGPSVAIQLSDGFGRVIEKTTNGVRVVHEYDAHGNLVFESTPFDPTATPPPVPAGDRRTYDAFRRLTQIVRPGPAGDRVSLRYLNDGALPYTEVTNERQHTTRNYVRALGDPDAVELMRVDAAVPSASVTLRRNVKGSITQATQGGWTRRYVFDEHFCLTTFERPEAAHRVYGRNAVCDELSITTAGMPAITHAIDSAGRARRTEVAGGAPIDRTWDRNNRLRTAVQGGAVPTSRTWTYDPDGRLTTDQLTIAGRDLVTVYGYDAHDRLQSITYPDGALVLALAPDAFGRPTTAGGLVTNLAYAPDGAIRSMTFGNGAVTTIGFDERNRPRTHRVERGAVRFLDLTRGYDGAGNVTSVTDASDPANNRTYGYDAIDRLAAVDGQELRYDGAGNLTRQTFGGLIDYTYDAQNRLATTTGARAAAYAYDGAGNMLTNGVVALGYDGHSRLACARCGGADRIDYTYDGTGVRATRATGGKTTYEVHDRHGNLIVELDPQTNQRTQHVYLGHERIATLAPGGATTYLHNEPGGTPLAATDAAGALAWRERYAPYGARIASTAPATQPPVFHAKTVDPAIGIADFGARPYDPVLGRFLGIDPVEVTEGNLHSINRYAYGNNNPVTYKDQVGRAAWFVALGWWALAGGTAGAGGEAIAQYAATGSVTDYKSVAISGGIGVIAAPIAGSAHVYRAYQSATTARRIATVSRIAKDITTKHSNSECPNCANDAWALDRTLGTGNPVSPLIRGVLRESELPGYAAMLGGRMGAFEKSIRGVEAEMMCMVDGARGVVVGYRFGEGEVGHLFNVININGEVVFLNAGMGRVSAEMMGGFALYRLIITGRGFRAP